MSDKNIILIGYSGHGYVVADVAIENNLEIKGYTELKAAQKNPFKLNYLGNEQDPNFSSWYSNASYLIGIGENKIREKIFRLIKSKGKNLETLLSFSSTISKLVKIGEGTFVNKNATINALTEIGDNVILNTACIIEHECKIEDSVHIGPGAVLAGNVFVGERSFVGANAVIKQGVKIGKDVLIGAGSVVLKDVPDGKKIVGNPGRLLNT